MRNHRFIAAILVGALASATQAQRTPAELKSLARQRLAQLDGQLDVSGLDSAVEVRRDQWGVPHIYAKTKHDLFFAQGFVAAQDRLFQMDLWRRAGEGRLAEVLGPSYVARDRFARQLKYRGDMGAEWSSYAPDARAIASAFTRGINAWVARAHDNPPEEFLLAGWTPAFWSEADLLNRTDAFLVFEGQTLIMQMPIRRNSTSQPILRREVWSLTPEGLLRITTTVRPTSGEPVTTETLYRKG